MCYRFFIALIAILFLLLSAKSHAVVVNARQQVTQVGRVIAGTDLGPMAMYDNNLLMAFGDSQYLGFPNFLLAKTSLATATQQISFNNWLPSGIASRAIIEPRYTTSMQFNGHISLVPNSLATITWAGKTSLVSQYEIGKMVGDDHEALYSGLALYNDTSGMFYPYKPDIYHWDGKLKQFGMAAIVHDGDYLYLVGSPAGRFGGIKLARIALSSFFDGGDQTNFQYYLGADTWSDNTQDDKIIQAATWLIPPKLASNQTRPTTTEASCAAITIAEFSVAFDRDHNQYILLTGRPCQASMGGGVYYYTAPSLTGPWSVERQLWDGYYNGQDWQPYGTYTTPSLIRADSICFVASTFAVYAVYEYCASWPDN